MLTNVIAYLHTTVAYQSAVVQLMAGQASFDAQQLHMDEPVPIVAKASTNDWVVAMPPEGVGGVLTTSNYVYRFKSGRLISIQKKPAPRTATQTAEPQTGSLDTNGVYQLARQWLSAIAVDVDTLERKYPHSVVPLGVRMRTVRERARPGTTNRPSVQVTQLAVPKGAPTSAVFRVTWANARGQNSAPAQTAQPVSIDINAATKQCVGLRIMDAQFFKGPPLQVTNAAALLGPPPPPQHFVENFFGGKAAYDAVAKPDLVVAWLLTPQTDDPDSKTNRTPAISVDANTAALLSKPLTDFASYNWLDTKTCNPDYGVRLRFVKGGEIVEVLWCYHCDHLQVLHNGQAAEMDCDGARSALVQAVRAIFPKDELIKNLSLSAPKQN